MKALMKTALATLTASVFLGCATIVFAAECGGDFGQFLAGVKKEAVAGGVPARVADQALAGARIDRKVLSMDRAQGVFKQTFLEFSKRSVSGYRMKHGTANMQKYANVFNRAEAEFGVPGAGDHGLLGAGDRFRRGSGRFQHPRTRWRRCRMTAAGRNCSARS